MKSAVVTADESERIEALEKLGLICSPAEERFDRITRIARQLFDVPIALVSLVSADRQWFKSGQGLAVAQTPRDISFCGHAIHGDDVFVIENAADHPDFADNPLVKSDPGIRFYAGQPVSFEGRRIGTLCIIDRRTRRFSITEKESLRDMARWVEAEFRNDQSSPAQMSAARAIDEQTRQAMIDPVTRVWNRHGLSWLAGDTDALAADGRNIAALLLRVDGLTGLRGAQKKLADLMMLEVGQRMRAILRPVDVLARYDDQSFLALLSDDEATDPAFVANRIIERIEVQPFEARGGVRALSASAGLVTGVTELNSRLDQVVERCQEALAVAEQSNVESLHRVEM